MWNKSLSRRQRGGWTATWLMLATLTGAPAAQAQAPTPAQPQMQVQAQAQTKLPVQIQTQEILIGQVAPFSGPLAPTGSDYARGLEIGFEQINGKGGIKGRKIKLVKLDDAYKSDQTVAQATAMLAEHKDLLLFAGFVGTGNLEALIKNKVLSNAGISLVGVRTGAVREHHPFVFHLRASYSDEVGALVRHTATIGMTRIAVLYQDDAFGKSGLQAAEDFAREYKVEIVARGAYEKNTTKVSDAVSAIRKADPQAIVMVANTAAASAFTQEYRAAGGTANLMAISVTDGEQLYKKIGEDSARGVVIAQVLPNPYARTSTSAREFQEAVAKSKVEDAKVNYTTFEGYITAKLLVMALEKTPRLTRADITRTLENMGKSMIGDFPIEFGVKRHEGSHFVELSVVSAGGKLLQ